MQYASSEAAEVLKPTFGQIQDSGRRPNWTYLNCNNSAADFSIPFKFSTTFDHVTADFFTNVQD